MANKPQGLKMYYPRCRTCAYAKENSHWRKQLQQTRWFDENSPETISDFYHRTTPPVPYLAFYRHMLNHTTVMKHSLENRKKKEQGLPINREIAPDILVPDLSNVEVVDTDYMGALDETIRKFHTAVRTNKIPLSLTGGLQAIKIRADIDKSNKDRKLDAFKAFSGMAKSERTETTDN